MSHQLELSTLLMKLFTVDDWHRWLRLEYGANLVAQVSAPSPDAPPTKYFTESILLLERHGLVNEPFFAGLARERPGYRSKIERMRDRFIAARLDASMIGPAIRTESPGSTARWRVVAVAALAGALVAGGGVWGVQRAMTGDGDGLAAEPSRRYLERCQESFLNLDEDVRIAPDARALREIVEEHVSRCKPAIEGLDPAGLR